MTDIKPNLQAIFQQAVELDSPEKIVQYLDNACGEDRELRAEVEGLISSHRAAGNFLGGTASQATIGLGPTERPGTQIGRYKLLQQIGEGGMGSVYMAEQLHPVQRMVALKVVKAGLDSRQIVARFEAERQSLAMMDHPNIAKVLDAGETDGGEPYFVMELVKGVPIKKYCDDNRLSTHDRIKLIVDVCSAVQHAHQKGIIHRDLKPSNILVAQYDDRPVPKVIDFGVAKATHQKLTEKTLYTQLGQIVGTLEYMSPEQAVLNQLDVDTRTDVYSLGVILYELLVGETPLNSKSLRSQGLEQILRTIREQEPPRPSLRLSSQGPAATQTAAYQRTDQKSLSKTLSGDLDWVVMKALEKDRKRRYDSASRLAEDLNNYLGGEAVEARPPTIGYRLKKSWQRNRVFVSSTAAVIVALLLGLVGMWEHQRQLQVSLDQKQEALSWVRDYCMLLAMTGEPDDEHRAVQIASNTNESDAWLLALQGTAESYRGNDHEAVRLYLKGLDSKPKDIILTSLLALNYGTTGDFRNYFKTSVELESLAKEASDEELIYAGWGLNSRPPKAMDLIRSAEMRRDSPLVDLAFADVACNLAFETRENRVIEEAIKRLEASRNLLGNTPQFYVIGLRLRYAAIIIGSHSQEEKKTLDEEANQCIEIIQAMPSSSFTLAHIAFYLDRFGNEEERSNAWEKLLRCKSSGAWQTYAIRALTFRTGDFRAAAQVLEGNPSTFARLWQAICFRNTDDEGAKKAEKIYQEIKADHLNVVVHSHLYFLENVGPLWRLKTESLAYLRKKDFPSPMAEAKAKFCADPSPRNEQRLRQLGRGSGLLRASALGSIARVRVLQANEATPKSNEQEAAQSQAIIALNEILRDGGFFSGDYYWADSMKQVLQDEWAKADLGQ